jgi:hypothetical protein
MNGDAAGAQSWRDWGETFPEKPAEVIRKLDLRDGYLRLRPGAACPDVEAAGRALVDAGRQLGEVLFQDDDQSWFARVEESAQASRRGSKTSRALIYHTDIGRTIPDLVLLYTARAAASGGASSIIGIQALADELRRTSPQALAALAGPWWIDGSMTDEPGKDTLLRRPILADDGEGLRIAYNRARVERGHRLAAQALTREQKQALDALDQALAATSPLTSFRGAPGELLILDNRVTLHARTSFAGDGSAEHERLLLRIWIRTGR